MTRKISSQNWFSCVLHTIHEVHSSSDTTQKNLTLKSCPDINISLQTLIIQDHSLVSSASIMKENSEHIQQHLYSSFASQQCSAWCTWSVMMCVHPTAINRGECSCWRPAWTLSSPHWGLRGYLEHPWLQCPAIWHLSEMIYLVLKNKWMRWEMSMFCWPLSL